jgi:hypothetical protein
MHNMQPKPAMWQDFYCDIFWRGLSLGLRFGRGESRAGGRGGIAKASLWRRDLRFAFACAVARAVERRSNLLGFAADDQSVPEIA